MRAVLDGVLLPVDSGAEWSYVDGVDRSELWLTLPSDMAQDLFDRSSSLGSVLELSDGENSERIEKLTILGTGPGPTPFQSTLQVVDLRYTWAYGPLIRRSYNVPRRSGGVRRLGGEDNPLAVRQLVEDLTYHSWSLNNGRVWTAEAIMQDLLNATGYDWEDRDGLLYSGRVQFPLVQDQEIASNPDQALATALALLGGRAGLFVRANGKVILYDKLNGLESELVGQVIKAGTSERGPASGPPRIVGGALYAKQDRRKERPSKVVVYYHPACEVRIDHNEAASNAVSETLLEITCYQACRYPEDVTTAAGIVVESTWGTLEDYLRFLDGKQVGDLPPLTKERIRKGYLHGLLEAYSYVDGTGVWAQRAATIRRHYRTTYRIRKQYVDRWRAIRAWRVAIEDVETQSQGTAPVYQDYAEWPTWRGITGATAADPPKLSEQVRNRYANPSAATGGSIVGTNLSSLKQAPAQVRILDEDLGIFDVEFVLDFTGQASKYVPSAIVPQRIPSADPSAEYRYLQEGWLSPGHQLSVVLTVQPAAPANEELLWKVEVTPQDVAEMLPSGGQVKAEGPELHVVVQPTRQVARFGWSDSRTEDIQAYFSGLRTLKDSYGEALNSFALRDQSKAIAARVYLGYEDHVEGGLLTGLTPGMELKGTARRITHAVGPQGATTTVDLPPDPPKVSEEALLPPSVQRLLGKIVYL